MRDTHTARARVYECACVDCRRDYKCAATETNSELRANMHLHSLQSVYINIDVLCGVCHYHCHTKKHYVFLLLFVSAQRAKAFSFQRIRISTSKCVLFALLLLLLLLSLSLSSVRKCISCIYMNCCQRSKNFCRLCKLITLNEFQEWQKHQTDTYRHEYSKFCVCMPFSPNKNDSTIAMFMRR